MANATYTELNDEYTKVEEEISQLGLRLEELYAKRGELRDQMNQKMYPRR